MKTPALLFVASIMLFGALSLRADDPDDAYVSFYTVLKQADKLSTNGAPQEALVQYQQAEVALRNLQKNHPDYNRQLIQLREAYLERRIDQLSTSNKVAVTRNASTPEAAPQPAANPPKAEK